MVERKKVYTETDIPDELMNAAAYHIAVGDVRQVDMESPQRLVARGMWLQQDEQVRALLEDIQSQNAPRH